MDLYFKSNRYYIVLGKTMLEYDRGFWDVDTWDLGSMEYKGKVTDTERNSLLEALTNEMMSLVNYISFWHCNSKELQDYLSLIRGAYEAIECNIA